MMTDWWESPSDGFRTQEELENDRRWSDLQKLGELRLYQYAKPGNRVKYLRQLKRCMKYGKAFVDEARHIRKWGEVKKPKFV